MGRCWGWTIGGAYLCMLSAWGGAPQLTTPLTDVFADPVPIRLDAPPAPTTRTEMLEWRAYGARYQLATPRTPNAPTRREFLCYALTLERGLNRLPMFDWRSEGELSPLHAPLNPRGIAVLFVGDLAGGYEFLKQIEYTPLQLRTHPALSIEAQSFPLTPVYLRPEQLPDHPAALLGIPFMVLTEGAERLSKAQQRALVLWLHAGGQLIVPLGAWASLLRRNDLAPYLPVWDALRLQTLTQPLKIPDTGAQLPPPGTPAPIVWLSHPRGVPLAQVGAHTLAVRVPCGYGQLIVFGGDLTHPAWRNWQGQTALWTTLLQRPHFPLLTLSELGGAPEHDAPSAAQRIAAAPYLTAILIAYGAALYALWRILRARRRLVYAPYGVALLSGLSLVALHFAVPAEAESEPLRGNRLIVGVGAHALERAVYRYRSPSGEWTLDWQHADALAVDPLITPGTIQVAFTGEGATLRGGGLTPTLLTLHTLRQTPAPLRLQRTPTGYQLYNASEHLTFEHIHVGRYRRPAPPSRPPAADQSSGSEPAWKWEPFAAWTLAPGESVPFPYEPSAGYVVQARAQIETASRKEQVEVWLFYP